MPHSMHKGKTEKTEELRRRIMDASVELFLENGYDKTTTRQILQKAGILNGSLYNIYHNKEEIFADIIIEALMESVTTAEKYVLKPSLQSIIGFPVALQLYASYRSPRIAELLTVGYHRWDLKDRVCDFIVDWISERDVDGILDVKADDFRIKVHLCIGAVGNMIEAVYKGQATVSEENLLSIVAKMMMDVFDIRTDNSEGEILEMYRAVGREDIVICGLHL